MQTIRGIIENRVNQYGVSEPIVQVQGADRVIVELPGSANEAQVLQLRQTIGRTGKLSFIPVPQGRTDVVQGQAIPSDLADSALFGGDQLSSAYPTFDETNRPAVGFELKGDGASKFATYTSSHIGEQFAIVLDNIVQSAPTIQSAITGGRGIISGTFTQSEVGSLVAILKYGSLPLDVQEVQISQISASLGLDFLQQSLFAGAIGVALVFVFMLLHYRLPGLIACFALIFYALIVYALFRLIPVTLTLAGVAAFVLSVGMAVDANILIFERTKEELRAGKTLPSAIEAGFNRAWNSIFDSNMSSIITASILFYFGSSTIRGFALVLIIGVLVSMFTAITLSRQMLRWVVRQAWARKANLYGVGEDEFTLAVAPRTRSREAGVRV
jgi:preprotein translocase subunit SecD